MPGNILSISVKVGDEVKKDQVLVILEAMKMENELISPVDGRIVSIETKKGNRVNAGDVLVKIYIFQEFTIDNPKKINPMI